MNKKYILYTSISALAIFAVAFSFFQISLDESLITVTPATSTPAATEVGHPPSSNESSERVTSPSPVATTTRAASSSMQAPANAPVAAENTIAISFKAGDASYTAHVAAGTNVHDAMTSLKAAGLSFTTKNFPGLGVMIESINGKGSADGSYWFLYINGKSSSTGASQTTLHAGDAVEWRYEKSY